MKLFKKELKILKKNFKKKRNYQWLNKLSYWYTECTVNHKLKKDRLTRLNGKMALVLCGGNSEVEIGENRDKIVDALNSVKSAMEHVYFVIF